MLEGQRPSAAADTIPRAIGAMTLSTKQVANRSGIDRFRTSGATKVAFPRSAQAVEGIVVNTSGGLTGGDAFTAAGHAGKNSHLVLTSQAAERAYRSTDGVARVRTRLSADAGATLHWLPQELIVFDGAALDRCLDIDVAPGAELVMAEPIVFGRAAMGETTVTGHLRDQITLRSNGTLRYWDRIALTGDITTLLNRPAVADGMTALATAMYLGPRAQALLPAVRDALPATGAASLIADDLLIVRVLAADSFFLRQSLIPVLHLLTKTTLPKSWSL